MLLGLQSSRGFPVESSKQEKKIPRPIPNAGEHPGNVYLRGELVRVRLPGDLPEGVRFWQVFDDRGAKAAEGRLSATVLESRSLPLGRLPVGWYKVVFSFDQKRKACWTTCAVLEPLAAPTPQDSPVCVDAAISWFARSNSKRQEQFARLAAVAGANWIRDRLKWREVEPEPGVFVSKRTYVKSAEIQNRLGLKILQVFHDTPPWAADKGRETNRFPPDLREAFKFCRTLSKRFRRLVGAWEPWNEPNVPQFGGHTFDQIASYQKAAYLGFKSGDPTVTVGLCAYTGKPTMLHAWALLANEVYGYFDTYNMHSYDWHEAYPDLWKPCRMAASGKPIWVTECDRGIKRSGGPPGYELDPRAELLKAQFLPQSYALSLFSGAERHFHFILGNYTENSNKVQFGLLRYDMTPRPAYVALAALGRMLVGAECLGKVDLKPSPPYFMIAFRALPGGVEKDVLVCWAEKGGDWPQRGKTHLPWPLKQKLPVEAVYDYLGRRLGSAAPAFLSSQPCYIVLPKGAASRLPLLLPLRSQRRSAEPSPVVLQLLMPRSTVVQNRTVKWAVEYDYVVDASRPISLPIHVYNFSDKVVQGEVRIDHLPAGWSLEPQRFTVSLAPLERVALTATLRRPARNMGQRADTWIVFRGSFGPAGAPVLAFRLTVDPIEGYRRPPPGFSEPR